MKTLTLKETQAPYNVALDDILLSDEVVILEKNGQPVAAVVPMAEYTAFQSWREAEKRRRAREAEETAIKQEHAAFQRMLPELLKKYPGQAVAVHNGEVVGVGDDEVVVWEEARKKFKGAPIYVQIVEYPPRVYKLPHRKVIR